MEHIKSYKTFENQKISYIKEEFNWRNALITLGVIGGLLYGVNWAENKFNDWRQGSRVASYKNELSINSDTAVVYTLPGCGYCVKLKNWFDKNGLPYKEVNIKKDRKAGEYIMNKSGRNGFPQTEIKGVVVVGYNPDKILKILSK